MLTKEQEQRQAIEMLCVDMLVPQDHLLRKVDAAVDFKSEKPKSRGRHNK